MIARRAGQRDAIDRLVRLSLLDRPPIGVQRHLLAAGRLRRSGKPVVIRSPIGSSDDLVVITLDQPAVLAEDHHPVGLCHNQVAVAGHEVAAGRAKSLPELDRRFGAQAGLLVKDLDLRQGRPVDQVAGEQTAAVAL